MRMRAAVLEEFGAPLVVQEIELGEPKAGEVLVRLVACGVCHTDMYTASGADPSGYAPAVLGHEGAGVVEKLGEGVKDLKVGDHVVTLFSPQCRECVHCLSPRTNLCMAIRAEQNQGHLPDGTVPRFVARRRADPPLHGHEHVRGVHGDAGDRAGEGARGGAAGPLRAVRLRPLDRPRRRDVHREGRAGLDRASSSAPAWSASARSRARGCRARSGSSASTSPRTAWSSPGARARPTPGSAARTPSSACSTRPAASAPTTRSRPPASSAVMRQAVESARMGWGLCTVAGVAGKGETLDIVPRYLITGPARLRLLLRRRQGPRPGAAARPALPRRRPRRRPVHLAPDQARRGQPRLRADAQPGRHPQRHRILSRPIQE